MPLQRTLERNDELLSVAVVLGITLVVAGLATVTAGAGGGEIASPTVTAVVPGSNASTTDGPPSNGSLAHPKVEDGLLEAPVPTGERVEIATPASASRSDRIPVVVETARGEADSVAGAIRDRGGRVDLVGRTFVEATVPRSAVPATADLAGVEFVRRPLRFGSQPPPAREIARAVGSVTSEGVEVIGADEAHETGYTGENVTVALVDIGFDPDDPEIADNVVRTKDFSGTGIDGDGANTHGTATAEIVVDTAPDTNLVLVTVSSYAEMIRAAEWINEDSGADVVSMSLGLSGGAPIDGSARLDREIAEGVRGGTVWMVSAGNEGDGNHWNGTWQDGDGDGWLNFTPTDETMSLAAPMVLTFQWGDWPDSDEDYDLYVYDSDGNLVSTSRTLQSGFQPPTERLRVFTSGTYQLRVFRADADGDASFDLFYESSEKRSKLEHWTEARSIVIPATGPRTTAIGAVDVRSLELEQFSSEGPTVDGRQKPAFVAPDRVSTGSYSFPFSGTSAAAPHAAGAAALVLDGDTSLSPEQLLDKLATTADAARYTDVPNNRVGNGLVDPAEAVRPGDPTATRILTDPITVATDDRVRVRVRFPSEPPAGDVVVRVRDDAGNVVIGRTGADTDDRTTTVTLDASTLSGGTVTARAKIVDGFDNANPEGFTAESDPVDRTTGSPSLTFSRSIPEHELAPNTTATVTSRLTVDAPASTVRLVERIEPVPRSLTLRETRIEGEGRIRSSLVTDGTLRVLANDLGRNATLVVEYELGVPVDPPADYSPRIFGRITAGETETVAIDEIGLEKSVAAYADEDGIVRKDGLERAVRDWATGEISDVLFQEVVTAWASRDSVDG